MKRTRKLVAIAGMLTAGVLALPVTARAQTAETGGGEPTNGDSLNLGEWTLRPSLQIRGRVEGRRHPFDTGGFVPAPADETVVGGMVWSPAVKSQWFAHERARLGLAAERGKLRAVVQVQDARLWGETTPLQVDQRDTAPATAAHLAYAEVREPGPRGSFLRLGRQEIQWGDGRLLGRSDWSITGRSLDAVRGVWVVGNFDIEGFASVLSLPGALPPDVSRNASTQAASSQVEGPGAQLHGLRVAWHIAPLLVVEVNGLARYVRLPAPAQIVPSDLYVAGMRLSGRHMGFQYSAEGVWQAGRIAAVGESDPIRAYAGAARAEVPIGLFWKMRLGAQAAYASGQKPGESTITRFDPILPDVHTAHGPMGLYAWSNVIEGAGWLGFTPFRESKLTLGYRYVALAQPGDAWQSSSLVRIGANASNESRFLGHELDAGFVWSPWEPLALGMGYGAFLTGDGARAILRAQGRGEPDVQHFGYLQATMTVP